MILPANLFLRGNAESSGRLSFAEHCTSSAFLSKTYLFYDKVQTESQTDSYNIFMYRFKLPQERKQHSIKGEPSYDVLRVQAAHTGGKLTPL